MKKKNLNNNVLIMNKKKTLKNIKKADKFKLNKIKKDS